MPVWIKDKLFQKSALIKELRSTIDEDVNWRDVIIFSNIIYRMQLVLIIPRLLKALQCLHLMVLVSGQRHH